MGSFILLLPYRHFYTFGKNKRYNYSFQLNKECDPVKFTFRMEVTMVYLEPIDQLQRSIKLKSNIKL